MSWSASARFCGPTAAVFHSSLSKSSIETKVGSPPMVRRTSPLGQRRVDLVAERIEGGPGILGKRLRDSRVFRDAVDLHVEGEIDLGEAGAAGNRRGVAVMRRGGERDVALAGQQAGGGVETDPAGSGQIDLGPGVQVGEVVVGARRAVDGDEVGLELDQIAGDEACGEAEVAQDLDEEPGGVAARALAVLERLLRRVDARLHADDVADLIGQTRVQADDEIDGAGAVARDRVEERLKPGADGLGAAIDHEVVVQVLGIVERPLLGGFLGEEIERVVDRHVGDEIDLDLQLAHGLGEDESGQPVAVRVLLVVHEMGGGADFEGVRDHAGARMRGRAQADDLRSERDGAVVFVVGQMVDAGFDRHGSGALPSAGATVSHFDRAFHGFVSPRPRLRNGSRAAALRHRTCQTRRFSMTDIKNARIAILATDGYERSELREPLEKLREMGSEVHVLSIREGEIRSWDKDDWGDSVSVDGVVKDASTADYDALVLPGGQINPDLLRVNEDAMDFIRAFAKSGKTLAAICHAPWLLVEAGALKGRNVTSYPSIRTDVENAGGKWEDSEVVVDQAIVTSRNPDDLPAFIDKIVEEIREGRHERTLSPAE